MNRYNLENNDFRSISKRPSKVGNLTLWNAFSFISIPLSVPEISSCKEKGNFSSFIISVLLAYSDLSLAPCLTDLPQTRDKRQTRFLEKRNYEFLWKNIGDRLAGPFLYRLKHYGNFRSLYLGNRSRYRVTSTACFSLFPEWTKFSIFSLFNEKPKTDINQEIINPKWNRNMRKIRNSR